MEPHLCVGIDVVCKAHRVGIAHPDGSILEEFDISQIDGGSAYRRGSRPVVFRRVSRSSANAFSTSSSVGVRCKRRRSCLTVRSRCRFSLRPIIAPAVIMPAWEQGTRVPRTIAPWWKEERCPNSRRSSVGRAR